MIETKYFIILYFLVCYLSTAILSYLMARDFRKQNPTKEIKMYDKEIVALALFFGLSFILLPIFLIILIYKKIRGTY